MFADLEHELHFLQSHPKPSSSVFGGYLRSSSPPDNQRSRHHHHHHHQTSPEPIMTEPHHHHVALPSPLDEMEQGATGVADRTTKEQSTSSCSRSFSDLDSRTFVGWTGALCALRTAAQQPLNLALTRQQTCPVAAKMTMGTIIREICTREGGARRGLQQGMMPLVVGCAVSEALYLSLYESSREMLPMERQVSRDSTAAYFSDVCCRIVHVPLSVIAYRQMTANSFGSTAGASKQGTTYVRPPTAADTCRALYREGGVRSVFAGLGSTLLIGCQWTAVWWVMYNQSKEALYAKLDPYLADIDDESDDRLTWRQQLLARGDSALLNSVASVVTSAATALLFNPFLVIRTRLQVTPRGRLMPIVRTIRQESGMRGFYAGSRLNVSSCVIDGFLASTSYEYAKLWSDTTKKSSA